ncbi:MAG: hypothetical protein A3F83_06205 [Candidatus Glassbacteria bacterium RIFCSPLOWO2_12_FULL_58_11]|uniref:siroheme decarboxylase n=1 Tax=Candidatus Glassbacteria bacterium RIFCSPLOWO2_12_FULL_58_11 TaxID=1817867 RepID=A0A1F5YZA8_9BACT|nr:MAG: hypothetical protein A3F83_06205 [Candidatus Glassbacteria bacterium RIFCSPLOWO2_12_FULL_58_11]
MAGKPENTFTEKDKELIRILQEDIPLCPQPYQEIARRVGLEHREVLERVGQWAASGLVRRFGATLYHQRAGFKANCMVAWQVPKPAQSREKGEIFSKFPQVTHCYRRPPFEGWPYTLYTMIHGSSMEEIDGYVEQMSRASGLEEREKLFSVREWKKTSMKYFGEEDAS